MLLKIGLIYFTCPFWTLLNLFSGPVLAQTPFPDIIRPDRPAPPEFPKPEPLPPPEDLLKPPTAPVTPQPIPGKVSEQIKVKRFEIVGNTVLNQKELDKILAPYLMRSLSFAELFQIPYAITQIYVDKGYITSGALIPAQTIKNGVVKIQIVEGGLEAINITGTKRLDSNYIRVRLPKSQPLNQQRLLQSLQLLRLNPLIKNISAELATGTRLNAAVLNVRVTEAQTFSTQLLADNGRSPSVGSFRRRAQINEANLLGLGDGLSLAYTNTDGSNSVDGSYTIPINSSNGTISLNAGFNHSNVIEEPFNLLDIIGNSQYYELTLRQPVVQTPNKEFTLGVSAVRLESKISSDVLEEFRYPISLLSPGADEEGHTKVSAIRFFQEWSNRNSRQVIAARSQFNLGVGAFSATINNDEPDSRFFSWQGQAQWVRLLAPDTTLLVRTNIQLATDALVPLEQFGLGGIESVRGYRQDALLSDNAFFASAEIRLPLYRNNKQKLLLQLTPFVDFGTSWDSSVRKNDTNLSNPDTLASVGLGLRLEMSDRLKARFDWGIPLIGFDSKERTWQEKGLYFSINYNPF